jgi:hypothetical protein
MAAETLRCGVVRFARPALAGGRLDRQGAGSRYGRPTAPVADRVTKPLRPVRVLHRLRCLIDARGPATSRDDLQLTGANDPGR